MLGDEDLPEGDDLSVSCLSALFEKSRKSEGDDELGLLLPSLDPGLPLLLLTRSGDTENDSISTRFVSGGGTLRIIFGFSVLRPVECRR